MRNPIIKSLIMLLSITLLLSACVGKEDLGDIYVPGQDHQHHFDASPVALAESETDYYFMGDVNRQHLVSKNKIDGKVAILCNKPDCLHDREEDYERKFDCNAYFGHIESLQYFDGKLYLLTNPSNIESASSLDDNKQVIYEFNIDGSGYKELLESKEHIFTMIVHRGSLYLSYSDFLSSPEDYLNDENLSSLSYRLVQHDLKNVSKKPKIIYEKSGQFGQINKIFAYGNNLYIRPVIKKSLEDDNKDYEMYIYNIQKEKVEPVPVMPFSTQLPVLDDKLFFYKDKESRDTEDYFDDIGVLADLDGNPVAELDVPFSVNYYSNGALLIRDNENLIRFDHIAREDRAIEIYDNKGQLIQEIRIENDTMPAIGMNQDYFFYLKRSDDPEGGAEIWAVDLNDLDNPNLKGEPFYQ